MLKLLFWCCKGKDTVVPLLALFTWEEKSRLDDWVEVKAVCVSINELFSDSQVLIILELFGVLNHERDHANPAKCLIGLEVTVVFKTSKASVRKLEEDNLESFEKVGSKVNAFFSIELLEAVWIVSLFDLTFKFVVRETPTIFFDASLKFLYC